MSRARHKEEKKPHRASGGKVEAYAGGESNVAKEAKKKTIGIIGGEKAGNRLDKPKRASGGAVKGDYSTSELKGSGGSPFTKAHAGENDRVMGRKSGGKC